MQLGQLSAQGPKRLAQQLQRFGARSHLSFGLQQNGDSSEGKLLLLSGVLVPKQ